MWKQACGHQLSVMLDPQFLADPRREAQAILKAAADTISAEKQKHQGSAIPAVPSTPKLLAARQESVGLDGQAGVNGAREGTPAVALPSTGSGLDLSALLPGALQGAEPAQNILTLLQEHAGEASFILFASVIYGDECAGLGWGNIRLFSIVIGVMTLKPTAGIPL